MHVVCTLYASCTLVVQNFDFSGGTHRRQPMMTHEKSKSCGATAEHFQFFQSSIRRQSVVCRQSVVGKTSETKQTRQTNRPPPRGGWAGGAAGHKWGGCCTAELQRRSSEAEGCHGARGVAAWSEVRSRCNGAAQVPHRYVPSAQRGKKKFCFSLPYFFVFQFGVSSISGGKTSVILNGGILSAICFDHSPKCFHIFTQRFIFIFHRVNQRHNI